MRVLPGPPARPPQTDLAPGRAILTRAVVQIENALADPEYARGIAVLRFSVLAVPMLREGAPIGVIVITRAEPGGFADAHIELLKTFADQAVIAIENVRLFTALQEKNRALTQAHAQVTEALDQQTATSEILRIISTSPTDLRPVLEAVVESAVRFCGAHDAVLFRLDRQVLRRTAQHGPIPSPINLIIPVVCGTVLGRSVLERRTVHVVDLQAEGEEFRRNHPSA